jgi:hypothetical protein
MKAGFVPMALVSAVLALSGCSSTGSGGNAPDTRQGHPADCRYSRFHVDPGGGRGPGGGGYVVYDPLAPNWEIEESRLNDSTYRFSMKMKRYHTGGAGESIQILKRRASQLQFEQGFGSYQIMEYSEGIDSQTIGARRVAEGVVRLVRPAAGRFFPA